MNIQEMNIIQSIIKEPYTNQRDLSKRTGHSIGVINKSLANLIKKEYLDENIQLTSKAKETLKKNKPHNAIILAAGFGMRMVPINMETPKALLEVNGETLIERQIKQLHKVGIKEIYVVAGFMKEQFEYLIDEYGVELVINSKYAEKNNLHSLNLVADHINNTYIIPCDIWCDTNPFSENELYSWYLVNDLIDDDSDVRVNRKMELARCEKRSGGNGMIGIAYITGDAAKKLKNKVSQMDKDEKYANSFWEEALYEDGKMIAQAKIAHSYEAVEINTYEQLRELDADSNQLKSEAISTIADVLKCKSEDIEQIKVLKKGMTNRSFLFSVSNQKYIMRIPGEGTDKLINRAEEAEVYGVIANYSFCEAPVYINPDNGFKMTRFIENARCCDAEDEDDVRACMRKLADFHSKKLKVDHTFDIFEKIDFYESLWDGKPSVYRDYQRTKENALKLKKYIDKYHEPLQLTHIDAVPDNFLFDPSTSGELSIQLTDWEYAAMQDPHVDIAMFAIYALYNKEQVDKLIDIYFEESKCNLKIRIKIYCYVAVCGLLWSNWCEYKRNLGVEFGEYSIKQYRYAKEYFRYATELMSEIGETV